MFLKVFFSRRIGYYRIVRFIGFGKWPDFVLHVVFVFNDLDLVKVVLPKIVFLDSERIEKLKNDENIEI